MKDGLETCGVCVWGGNADLISSWWIWSTALTPLHSSVPTHTQKLPHTCTSFLSFTHYMRRQGEIKWSCFHPEEPTLSNTGHQFTHNWPQGRHFSVLACVCACVCFGEDVVAMLQWHFSTFQHHFEITSKIKQYFHRCLCFIWTWGEV